MSEIRIKRIYERPDPDDGVRVLVDRVWPRGVSRQRAALDRWLPEVAPSRELRRWFGHDPARFAEFARHYRRELEDNPALDPLAALAGPARLTLLYSAADTDHNQAVVLAAFLREQSDRAPRRPDRK